MNEETKSKNKILIAEDDPVSRRVLESFLVKWGYEVIVAVDGTQALHTLQRLDSPRLAVLDWMMPGLEGTQVCQKIREESNRAYIYILLLTARGQKEDILKGLDSGADDYLTKPFDAQELRARLHVGQRILDLQDNLIAAREALLFQATHDALTGVANRGVILDALRRERSRQVREGGEFAVVLLDLDHFKYVNDQYGHISGDAVLQEAALRMTQSVRPYDTVGRFGGEEFLIVVPASGSTGALGLAERIRKAIESKPVSTQAGDIQITASLGVAVSSEAKPLEPQAILQAADDALYRAKDLGRNRTELAAPAEPAGQTSHAPERAPVKSSSN
ncbi:MAG: diguanylate cyclase [Candidatus Acidiferrales bacterium]